MCKLASLESEVVQLRSERDELSSELQTLRRTAQQHQQDAHNRQSVLENKIQELETLTRTLPRPDSMLKNVYLLSFLFFAFSLYVSGYFPERKTVQEIGTYFRFVHCSFR